MNEYGNPKPDLNWLLDDVVSRVVGAQNAIVLSADGLLIGKSAGMSKDDSDQLSAIASSLQSLAKGVSKQFNRGPVLQNMIEMERGYLFVSAAGPGRLPRRAGRGQRRRRDDRLRDEPAGQAGRGLHGVRAARSGARPTGGHMSGDDGWYDEAAGPLVRPYTITSGRTPADSARLDLSTQVMTLRSEQEPAGLGPEHLVDRAAVPPPGVRSPRSRST